MLRYGNMVVEYGFVGFVIMLVLHILCVCSSFLCIELCFVLCAYHVHDKMSLRCFCVSLDSVKYKVCRDSHVSLISKHQMIMCFYTLP